MVAQGGPTAKDQNGQAHSRNQWRVFTPKTMD